MKMLSFQSDSLYAHGGAGRVLRRLYKDHESEIQSLYVSLTGEKYNGTIRETRINAYPLQKKWLRWKLRSLSQYMQSRLLYKATLTKLRNRASEFDYSILHVVNHGFFNGGLFQEKFLRGKELWGTFYDYYTQSDSSREACAFLWKQAARRMVISEKLGKEYQKQFGALNFEIFTDGVYRNEISEPRLCSENQPVVLYFGGLLHYEYLELFEVLAKALEELVKVGMKFKFVLRGTPFVNHLHNKTFEVEYRQDFVTDEQIKTEIDQADILYLPIKFQRPEFARFSLSTKMVGYLGASGVILHHGPQDSAANEMLTTYDAAVSCNSLETTDLKQKIIEAVQQGTIYSANAKVLAAKHFLMEDLQKQFWTNRETGL